jgi:uncharacterized protein YdhG (YjbR/CyaY superfamily)
VPSQFTSVDDYIAAFPDDVRVVLTGVREALHRGAPGAAEAIKYNMPTITLGGRSLVHFAAWKKHLGLYPVPDGDEAFERRLAPYRQAKGTANFPLRQPIPYDLIEDVAALLVERAAAGETGWTPAEGPEVG